ncbi:hypothetical protein [uncultured Microbulbifer sp.]|uniref:hypothetical protein n=1 Tax=uncultured Microbulbifer sp. TaxID=348147 RepID=UPI002620FD09|nr:hypothetical protein [uncultured Microbulbifer sp.]
MSFKIDSYLENATQDKILKDRIVSIHDDLFTAHKIVESVQDAIGSKEASTEQLILEVFKQLYGTKSS